MADNIDNSTVADDVVAADDVSGVKFQRVKVALGADGVFVGDLSDQFPMPIKPNGVSVFEDIAPVLINGSYTSPQMHTHVGASFKVAVVTNVPAPTNLYKVDITIQESIDGVNFRTTYMIHNASVFAGGDYLHETPVLPVSGKYLRYVVNINGETGTVSFIRMASNLVVPIQRQVVSKAVALYLAVDLSGLMIDAQSCSKVRLVCTPTDANVTSAKVVLYGTHDLSNWFPISDALTIRNSCMNILEADTCGAAYIKAGVTNDYNGSYAADLIVMRVS